MFSDEDLIKEGERIVQEFRSYSKLFVLQEFVELIKGFFARAFLCHAFHFGQETPVITPFYARF